MQVSSRLFHSGHMFAADPNPGNYIFMPDGRMGLVDFGCVREFTTEEWEVFQLAIQGYRNRGEDLRTAIQRGSLLSDEEMKNQARYDLIVKFSEWYWEPLQRDEPFDFGQDDYLARGCDLMGQIIRRRFTRALPVYTWMNRTFFGLRALCFFLRAHVNLKRIDDEEAARAGN
jgi:hypothetical protein